MIQGLYQAAKSVWNVKKYIDAKGLNNKMNIGRRDFLKLGVVAAGLYGSGCVDQNNSNESYIPESKSTTTILDSNPETPHGKLTNIEVNYKFLREANEKLKNMLNSNGKIKYSLLQKIAPVLDGQKTIYFAPGTALKKLKNPNYRTSNGISDEEALTEIRTNMTPFNEKRQYEMVLREKNIAKHNFGVGDLYTYENADVRELDDEERENLKTRVSNPNLLDEVYILVIGGGINGGNTTITPPTDEQITSLMNKELFTAEKVFADVKPNYTHMSDPNFESTNRKFALRIDSKYDVAYGTKGGEQHLVIYKKPTDPAKEDAYLEAMRDIASKTSSKAGASASSAGTSSSGGTMGGGHTGGGGIK